MGAKGTFMPSGLPAGMSHQADWKNACLYKATVLKVQRGAALLFGRFSARPWFGVGTSQRLVALCAKPSVWPLVSTAMPKSPRGFWAGLGTNQICASCLDAAKLAYASRAKEKSGIQTSPAATQNTSANIGSARIMPPAVSNASPKSSPSCE